MTNVYESCPVFITPGFTLRLVRREDAPGLLKVYSDKQAQEYFNADNCTSDFRYSTLREMEQCIDFWLTAYARREFVRWVILDERRRPVGTVEMFRRGNGKDGKGEGVLRMDVSRMYEFTDVFERLLQVILPAMHELFHCERILTKALPHMQQRRLALVLLGFVPSRQPLMGRGGIELPHYWAHRHTLASPYLKEVSP